MCSAAITTLPTTTYLYIKKNIFVLHTLECMEMMFGHNCGQKCQCDRSNTVMCDPQTGACHCRDTWTGLDCSQDINECLRTDICPPISTCSNTPGGYSCVYSETGHGHSENEIGGKTACVFVLFDFSLPLLRKYLT